MIHSLKTKTAKKDPLFDLLLHQSVSCNILISVITALISQFKLSLKKFWFPKSIDAINKCYLPLKLVLPNIPFTYPLKLHDMM